MEYIIVPMDRGHIPQIAALERECFSTPWSENMLSDALFDPNARRHGVADELLDVFCRCGAANLAFLTLEVRASNAPAIALYRKHGFQEAGRRKNYYQQPREDAIIISSEFEHHEAE